MFWYNPYQGVIRTRVPAMISDQRSLDLYNRLNRCTLQSIFPTEADSPTPPESGAAPTDKSSADDESNPDDEVVKPAKPNASRG
jgi:hypothetical protein